MPLKPGKRAKVAKMVSDGRDIFIVLDDVKIAKRRRAGTPQAKTWISLEPGWSVLDGPDGESIEVSYQGVRVQ
jgi:hypothetical protein